MINQKTYISGTPIRDSVTNRQIGWTGPGGSIENMHGKVGYINTYNNTVQTFRNGQLYESRIDTFGNVTDPIGSSNFRIG